ncbi:MAG TPA: outer membrane beta-barrel protein [Tepidisphaeraceae bacterium]|jgi:hypothetical protein|nr:outer membrane beta-barrel protein [Tepidisphaeraceae bacterium]
MLGRTRFLLATAVCAVAFIGTSAARADDATKQDTTAAPAAQPAGTPTPPTAAAAPTPPKPLMSLLDSAGIGQPLDNAGISIYGFAEGSYTYNARGPVGNTNVGRVFDVDNENPQLNQLDLTIQRTVDPTKKSPDIGFTVEAIYGSDGRFIHSNGLDFYGPGDAVRGAQMDPENQVDLVQAYVDVALVQNVMLRAGEFATHMGYETINPTTNPLFSHSYLFGYAIPFKHTGAEVYWNATDKLTIMVGVTRGWEESLKDDNRVLDYVGQAKYVFSDKLTGYLNFTAGPEKATNNDDTRVVLDAILQYAVTDKFSVAANADYGWEEDDQPGNNTGEWYGLAMYAGYKINDPLTLNIRGEWFNDQDGARGLGTTVYEGTAGVTVTPFPSDATMSNLKLRPEIRYDYAEDPIFDNQNSQLSLAMDVIFSY